MNEDYKHKSTKQLVAEYVQLSRACSNLVANSQPTDNEAWRRIHSLDDEKAVILEELERRTGERTQ